MLGLFLARPFTTIRFRVWYSATLPYYVLSATADPTATSNRISSWIVEQILPSAQELGTIAKHLDVPTVEMRPNGTIL
jgi:hypothetical protein